jgi:hypothetical protein
MRFRFNVPREGQVRVMDQRNNLPARSEFCIKDNLEKSLGIAFENHQLIDNGDPNLTRKLNFITLINDQVRVIR